ncbi:SIMPL domain-containing protein [Algicola sagamiensis]|uniref:SIMPL domain-containing protein n=1 Tax=Algicola sagamiensis TaxID=163869 RepID=UPI000370260E|nr:SIMPL domain-containing protein [Algicola sagamiensis]
MKKRLLLTPLMALLATSPVFAASERLMEDVLSVTGKGSITHPVDLVTLNFSFEQRSSSVEKAKGVVDHKVDLFTSQLLKLGVDPSNIQDATYRVYPHYDQKKSSSSVEFQVTRGVALVLENLKLYANVLEMAANVGVTHIGHAAYSIKNESEIYEKALRVAVENAKRKAQHLANVSGRKLGKIIAVTEQSGYAPAPMMEGVMMAAKSGGRNYHHGGNYVEAAVSVTFDLD